MRTKDDLITRVFCSACGLKIQSSKASTRLTTAIVGAAGGDGWMVNVHTGDGHMSVVVTCPKCGAVTNGEADFMFPPGQTLCEAIRESYQ